MSFGLTPLGFIRKRLDDVKAELEAAVLDEFGEVNTEPDSVFGQLIGIFSNVIANLWQEMENTYFSQYPATADGVSLDNAVDLVGIRRLEATKSRVLASITGDQSTLIPAGSQVSVAETGEIFENPEDGVITRSNAQILVIEVTQVTDSTDYTVLVNGVSITYNSGVGATADTIAAGLVSAINGETEPVTANDLGGGEFDITTDQDDLAFNGSVGTGLTITSRTSPLLFEALETGPITVLSGTFTEIVTPVNGWDSVSNIEDGVAGRDLETDQELRIRRLNSIRVLGAGSVEAIQARLRQEVQDVLNALVFENREPFEVDGRPAHSFETVVQGGDDTEIAEKIWELKPAGIQTFGNVNVLITDSNGDSQSIFFSRPEPVYVWVEVDLTVISGEFSAEGPDAVAAAILAFGQSYNVGEDILYQEFTQPIYNVGGIELIDLTLATSATPAGPPGAYSAANLTINEVEIGDFDLTRITVNVL
jgi:uncharacterized phage protein gp47/JayE